MPNSNYPDNPLKPTTDRHVLLESLLSGATVITPNNRLSNLILSKAHSTTLEPVINKPHCLPYNAFLKIHYQNCINQNAFEPMPILLSSFQEHALWQQVLNHHFQADVEFSFVQAIQKNWKIGQQWCIPIEDASFSYTRDTQLFQKLQRAFQKTLNALPAITLDQVIDYLIPLIKPGFVSQIYWAAFNEFSPQQKKLQACLHALGIEQFHYDVFEHAELLNHTELTPALFSSEQTVLQYPAADEQEEIQQMFGWVKQQLEAGAKHIAVVMPDLQNQFRSVERLAEQNLEENSYTLSLGKPLIEHPLIYQAYALISLEDKLAYSEAELLLQSPYISGSETEFYQRADILQENPYLKEAYLSLKQWIPSIKNQAPQLAEILQSLEPYPEKASPMLWSELFRARLIEFGFPGETSLNSASYQLFQQLEQCFETFIELTLIENTLSKADALAALSHLFSTTIFQTQKQDTPVMFLGLLEAQGGSYDSLWIQGMDFQCLPESTQLSAYLPIPLQKTRVTPKSCSEKEFTLAMQNLYRIIKESQNTVISYPKMIADMPNLPSPLIRHLDPYQAQTQQEARVSKTVVREESYAIPLGEAETYTGGSALLGNQAKCPFKAFATHRLKAKAPASRSFGPDASERGQVIHKVLECIWQNVRSQKNLLAMDSGALNESIQRAIDSALKQHTSHRTYSFSPLVQQVERERLQQLVETCIDWERKRPPFTVKEVEQAHTIQLADLTFNIRVDRIDKVGSKDWIIDYKTTLPSAKPWYADRPQDPQLLLYALLDSQINALLFIQLKKGTLKIGGISELDFEMEGLKPIQSAETWGSLQAHWLEVLTKLAEEFKQGHCPPTPASSSLCQVCDFPSLCRIPT